MSFAMKEGQLRFSLPRFLAISPAIYYAGSGLLQGFFSEGHGCLQEGCLGLPGVLPDIFRIAIFLGNEGKDGKNRNSQTWPGTPRRPSSRHPRPS